MAGTGSSIHDGKIGCDVRGGGSREVHVVALVENVV